MDLAIERCRTAYQSRSVPALREALVTARRAGILPFVIELVENKLNELMFIDAPRVAEVTGLDVELVSAALGSLGPEQRRTAVSEFFDGIGPLAAAQQELVAVEKRKRSALFIGARIRFLHKRTRFPSLPVPEEPASSSVEPSSASMDQGWYLYTNGAGLENYSGHWQQLASLFEVEFLYRTHDWRKLSGEVSHAFFYNSRQVHGLWERAPSERVIGRDQPKALLIGKKYRDVKASVHGSHTVHTHDKWCWELWSCGEPGPNLELKSFWYNVPPDAPQTPWTCPERAWWLYPRTAQLLSEHWRARYQEADAYFRAFAGVRVSLFMENGEKGRENFELANASAASRSSASVYLVGATDYDNHRDLIGEYRMMLKLDARYYPQYEKQSPLRKLRRDAASGCWVIIDENELRARSNTGLSLPENQPATWELFGPQRVEAEGGGHQWQYSWVKEPMVKCVGERDGGKDLLHLHLESRAVMDAQDANAPDLRPAGSIKLPIKECQMGMHIFLPLASGDSFYHHAIVASNSVNGRFKVVQFTTDGVEEVLSTDDDRFRDRDWVWWYPWPNVGQDLVGKTFYASTSCIRSARDAVALAREIRMISEDANRANARDREHGFSRRDYNVVYNVSCCQDWPGQTCRERSRLATCVHRTASTFARIASWARRRVIKCKLVRRIVALQALISTDLPPRPAVVWKPLSWPKRFNRLRQGGVLSGSTSQGSASRP